MSTFPVHRIGSTLWDDFGDDGFNEYGYNEQGFNRLPWVLLRQLSVIVDPNSAENAHGDRK